MSNPPSGSGNPPQRNNHLQSEPIPFSVTSAHQLAQMAAAASKGYVPKSYSNAQTFAAGGGFVSASSANQTQPSTTTASSASSSAAAATTAKSTTDKPPSEFASSAYATAQTGDVSGLQPPPAQPVDLQKFKGLKFVTLDGLLIETREIYDEISGTFQWEMCESQDNRCLTFCQENADRRIFLISSGSLGRTTVPIIHNLPQVYAIYIYCADVQANQKWANEFTKVRVVCNDDDQYLLPQLAVDVAQANIEWGDALMKDGKRDKAKDKYTKALKNLTEHAKRPNPTMIAKVKAQLEACK